MIKLSDYIMNFLSNNGVQHVFMVAGGGAMHLDDSLGQQKNITAVCCLHEQGAAIAAQAYAQSGAIIGVALVTTGPGGTNALTGLAAAWVDSVPLVIISGQVKRSTMIGDSGLRSRGSQELNIISMVKSVTKYAITVMEPEEIRYHLEKAFYEAKNGRPGPVWLDIPLDVQACMIDEDELKGFNPQKDAPNFPLLEHIVKTFNQSKRPVIMAGHGLELGHAEQDFIKLITKLNAPVLTTWRSLGLIGEDHPLFCGRPGGIGQRGANFVQQKADFILSIGCRLDNDQVGFRYDNFGPQAIKFIIDVDQAELSKFSEMKQVHTLQVDAGLFIRELSKQEFIPGPDSWAKQARSLYQQFPVVLDEYRQENTGVNVYYLTETLSDMARQTDVISPGNSAGAPNCTFQTWKVKKGQKFICAAGFGSMGFGIPSAMGSALANSDQRVICVNGDGGWQLNTQELETISRLDLNIKFFVLNNNGYASIRNMQNNYFCGRLIGSTPESGLTLPDT
jgi:acetolactate synthase I/II/III large subunit